MAATIRFLVLGLVFLASGQSTQSKKILALEFFGSKSHVITYLPVLEELVRKGHQVTFQDNLITLPILTLSLPFR